MIEAILRSFSKSVLYLSVFPILVATVVAAKPRVFVLTDINLVGGNPDDRQSLVHVLWYANELEIEGIVPDRWNGKGREACQLVIDAYNKSTLVAERAGMYEALLEKLGSVYRE